MNRILSRAGVALVLVVVAGSLVGCNTQRLKDERDALYLQNQELQDRLTQTQAAHDAAVSDRERTAAETARLQAELAATREREAAAREAAARAAVPANRTAGRGGAGSFNQISDVESFEQDGRITVRVAGDVLFSPGQATLKASSRQTLARIATVLKNEHAGSVIRIDGYTDSDPIRKSKWKSNQELSQARADAVSAHLRQQGIPASRLVAQGHGSTNPRATKAQSRRVEIVVMVQGR